LDYNSAVATVRSRGRLPHWEADDAIYFVTFRLADSLPRAVLRVYDLERQSIMAAVLAARREFLPSEQKRLEKLFSEKIESKLDAGAGRCYLAKPAVADVVLEALRHFDSARYQLYSWCLMPNDVHVLFRLLGSRKLAGVLHSWKSYSAQRANLLLGLSGEFWQREYYDHLVRSEEEFYRIVEYIVLNPEKAGLRDWRWVGASLKP
jgi:REP element-mobilizing transposase RayT